MTNEAAERLFTELGLIESAQHRHAAIKAADEALAAERRATVERLAERLRGYNEWVDAILDEEAAR